MTIKVVTVKINPGTAAVSICLVLCIAKIITHYYHKC